MKIARDDLVIRLNPMLAGMICQLEQLNGLIRFYFHPAELIEGLQPGGQASGKYDRRRDVERMREGARESAESRF